MNKPAPVQPDSGRPRDVLTGLLWISPWLMGFLFFTLLPVLISGYLSFCEFDGLRPPIFTGSENLRMLAADSVFWKVLKNTAIYAAISLPLATLVAITLAILLNTQIPGRALWRAIIFVPTLVPLVATAMVWLWLFNGRYGLINVALAQIGIEGPTWLGDARWTMPSMILIAVWSVGNAVVVYLAGLQDVPRTLYEAAHVDGASGWQRLWNVTLPMISPAIFFNVVIGLIFVWQVFAVPQIMIPGGGPERSAYFYTNYLYDLAFQHLRFGYACTMSWIQLIITVVLTLFAFQVSKRFVHYQGGGA